MTKTYLVVIALFSMSCTQQVTRAKPNGDLKKASASKPANAAKPTPKEDNEQVTIAQPRPPVDVFNIDKLNENKDEAGIYVFTRDDGTVVTQFGDSTGGYYEYSRKPSELFEDRKAYYPDGMLKIHGTMYHNDFPKGVWEYYDPHGKLERTVDYDAPFEYGWEKVLAFCKQKKIDLLAPTTRIAKLTEDGPQWTIAWKIDGPRRRVLTLDGQSGKILKQETQKLHKG